MVRHGCDVFALRNRSLVGEIRLVKQGPSIFVAVVYFANRAAGVGFCCLNDVVRFQWLYK